MNDKKQATGEGVLSSAGLGVQACRPADRAMLATPADAEDENDMLHNRAELSYSHVPAKPAFSVQATYKFIGKLKPRVNKWEVK